MTMELRGRDGLAIEVAGRELTGGLRTARGGARPWSYLVGLPATVLVVALVVAMAWTVTWVFDPGSPSLFDDPDALRAAWHSVLWVGIAIVLLVAGYLIALVSRLVSGLWRVLLYLMILPFGVSAMVAGATFRMIFDPTPERGMLSALFGGANWLGPDLIWWVLASAFAWSWLGFVVVLFRAGLDANAGFRHRLGPLWLPRTGPVTSIVVLTVLVAAIRVFELVLVVAPGSMRDDVDVVGLHWWRMTMDPAAQRAPATLAVLLFAVVAVLGPATQWVFRRSPPELAPVAEPPSARTRWWSWVIGVGIALLWMTPLVVLVATALHDPVTAGSAGWWNGGFGLGSFAAVSDSWLWPALVGNLLVAGFATGFVLAIAAPAAYLLTWRLPRRVATALTALLGVLAVAPVQMYAGPLGDLFAAGLGWVVVVHVAAGLPFAILVLRAAFAAAPSRTDQRRPTLDTMWRRGRYRPAMVAVAVLEFVLVWNDFIVGFVISGPGTSPLTLLLWGEARQFATAAGTVAAGAVVSAIVPVAILLATWRTVVRGLTGGMTR